ncbi:glycosyltransferase [Promineifilum sp.]|uniref:glycosyltransferase n=1 Tax=Promineifilum sp. TaxID=2664178 RepID=UPI0035B0DD0B
MTPTTDNNAPRLRLAWVSPLTPWKLDSVTWLDTTRELRRLGMDVTLLAAGRAGPANYRGIEVLNIPRPETYFIGRALFHLRLLRYLWPRLSEYDFVLFHPISAIWLFPLRLWRRRPLLVMDSRDLLDFGNKTLKARLRNALERFTYRLATRLADGQTAITPRLAELVGVPPAQLWGVWPSGVNPEPFAAARAARQWPAAGEPLRLVYAGIFLEQRNLLPLVRAVRRANDEGMAFALTLYGDGPLRPALEAGAAETGGRVRVARPIPYEQIPAMLGEAHIGVTSLPSPDDVKYEASSPLKLFEYMAAGLPVVATSNRCHTDVVGAGGYAFWAADATEAELLGALRQAWAARDRLPELGEEAYRAADEWTWAASARKLFGALEAGWRARRPGRAANYELRTTRDAA